MSNYHCSKDYYLKWANASCVISNLTTPSLTPSSQGGYSGFQVTGSSNWDKNQPPKNKPRVSNKTQTTLGTPKNIYCFINNIQMTTSNCFEYAKNPHVDEIVTKKIPNPTIGTHSFKSLVRKSLCRYPVKFFKASIYFTCSHNLKSLKGIDSEKPKVIRSSKIRTIQHYNYANVVFRFSEDETEVVIKR